MEGLIKYSINAQITPRGSSGWSEAARHISSFRGSRMIYIFRPPEEIQTRDRSHTLNINSKVGGFLGICTSECKSEFIFEKNEYYPGEVAKVKAIIDNSNCSKDVRYIEIKLQRDISLHYD